MHLNTKTASRKYSCCSLLLRRFVFRMARASAKRVTGDEPQGTPSRLPLRARSTTVTNETSDYFTNMIQVI